VVAAAEGAAVEMLVGGVGAGPLGHVVVVDTDFFHSAVVVKGAVLTNFLLRPERFPVGKAFGVNGMVVSLHAS
jgi:hypothetical protein